MEHAQRFGILGAAATTVRYPCANDNLGPCPRGEGLEVAALWLEEAERHIADAQRILSDYRKDEE